MPPGVLGIPDRQAYGDPSTLRPGSLIDWIVQKHNALRAGPHFDVRFGTPETGLYSWAVPKGLPAPGAKHLAVQQPLHAHSYAGFEGRIPRGYGAGTVSTHDKGEILVTKVMPNQVHFTTAHRRFPERYALIKPKTGRNWLMLNTTKTEPIPYEKVHYKSIAPEKAEKIIENLQPGSSVQAKIDGAASLTRLYKDHFEVASYRRAKETGYPIIHTERYAHGRPEVRTPKDLIGTVLRGELYGADPSGAIHPQDLGGILNSGVAKSIRNQQDRGVTLKNLVFDLDTLGNKKITPEAPDAMPYADRLAKVREILGRVKLPNMHEPEEATTPESAKSLWNQVASGEHPLSREGIVIHQPRSRPMKVKLHDEHDVHIRRMFPGLGKYQDQGVGGFYFSHEPEGQVVGKVGSGLTDEMRRMMHQDPEAFVGRIARLKAQEKYPSGALRAPVFMALHEDYPTKPSRNAIQAAATTLNRPVPPPQKPKVIEDLLRAKFESDRKNYPAKHEILRRLIKADPKSFRLDADEGQFAGVTHDPTKFKIHMPKTTIPDVLRFAT